MGTAASGGSIQLQAQMKQQTNCQDPDEISEDVTVLSAKSSSAYLEMPQTEWAMDLWLLHRE